jgi:O-antigen/teichoic acid export membrane protein
MIRKNIIANVIARAWGVISVYLFVPLYLKFLGIEAYGLVGFYSTLLAVCAFADMGFTATLNREMARLSVRKDSAGEMRDLLRTYELIYLGISLALASTMWALAPLIASDWLHSTLLHPRELALAIRLMGLAIVFQLPSGLYIGGLMGMQRQVGANSIQIAWGVCRGVGAVLILWLYSPTIYAFAAWQLISNVLYCFSARFILWRGMPPEPAHHRPGFSLRSLRTTWRYSIGITGMALISTVLTQTDKLAVSKLLPLTMLGYYSLAGAVAGVPLMLAGPIGSAFFPRMTGLVALEDCDTLTRLYHRACSLVAIATIPAGLTVAAFAGECIYVWTGSAVAADRAGLAASLLICGQLMQATTLIPYYLGLAHGNVEVVILVGIASVVVITPLLLFLVMKYGIVGAGVSWLIMNVCTLPPYMYAIHRRFLPGEFRTWALSDVGRPLLAALPGIILCRFLLPSTSSRLLALGLIGAVWAVSTVAAAATSLDVREWVLRRRAYV